MGEHPDARMHVVHRISADKMYFMRFLPRILLWFRRFDFGMHVLEKAC